MEAEAEPPFLAPNKTTACDLLPVVQAVLLAKGFGEWKGGWVPAKRRGPGDRLPSVRALNGQILSSQRLPAAEGDEERLPAVCCPEGEDSP